MSDAHTSEERVILYYVALIPQDDSTQTRAGLDESVVLAYSADMEAGCKFPPVILYEDADKRVRVGDGFTRLAAARALGRQLIDAIVRQGGHDDAWECSIRCNRRNGQRYTRADHRKMVNAILDKLEESGRELSNRAIALKVGCSHTHVNDIKAERSGGNASTRDGGLTESEKVEFARNEAVIKATLPDALRFHATLTEMRRLTSSEEVEDWLTKECGARMAQQCLETEGFFNSIFGQPEPA